MSTWQAAAVANVAAGVACAALALRWRRRLGLRINDGIVQGLARARWALETRRYDEAQAAADETLAEAQRIVTALLTPAAARGAGRKVSPFAE